MDQQRQHHLVTGAGGAQGGAITRRLITAGRRVRALVRSPAGHHRIPAGALPRTADLGDTAAVADAFGGITHAALHLPLVHDPADAATPLRTWIAAQPWPALAGISR